MDDTFTLNLALLFQKKKLAQNIISTCWWGLSQEVSSWHSTLCCCMFPLQPISCSSTIKVKCKIIKYIPFVFLGFKFQIIHHYKFKAPVWYKGSSSQWIFSSYLFYSWQGALMRWAVLSLKSEIWPRRKWNQPIYLLCGVLPCSTACLSQGVSFLIID